MKITFDWLKDHLKTNLKEKIFRTTYQYRVRGRKCGKSFI